MAKSFEPSFVFDFVQSFWRDYYKDRGHLARFWEAAVRLLDDEWAQVEQINDSAHVVSVPTWIYHTHQYRKLEDWQAYGLPHRHFRHDWRATAGQTIFYTGSWPDPATAQVFLNGKEVDELDDPYTITYDQDATQPGVNPSGVRLIFANPITAGIAVSLFSDREYIKVEHEVPAGGTIDLTFAAPIDPDSARIVLKKLRLDGQITLTATSFSLLSLPSTVADVRRFRKGEVFEIVDGATVQVVGLDNDTAVVTFGTPVNPLTASVFKVLDFEITQGKVTLDEAVLVAVDQVFPSGATVRVADERDSMGIALTEPTRSIEYPRAVNPDTYRAYMFGGELVNGYTCDINALHFGRSFVSGLVFTVQAALVTDNDHAEYRSVVSAPTNTVSVPVTRPFALSPLLQEQPQYPVQFFVDGHLQAVDTYSFLSTTTILSANILPAGSVVDLYYVDADDPIPHLHVREYKRIGSPVAAFKLDDYVSDRFSRYVNVGGTCLSDPLQRQFRQQGSYVAFQALLSSGTLIRVRGAHPSYAYYHELTDDPMVRAAYLQNGLDQQSAQITAGWTIQLPWDTGFLISPGLLEANAKIEDAWFVDAYVDERTGFENFGSLIGIDRETSEEYTRILKALVPGSYSASTPAKVESLACIVMGSEYIPVPAKVDSIVEDVVHVGSATYEHDSAVPLRVQAGVSYGRFEAVSQYVKIIHEWSPFDALALLGSGFSDDYTFARTLDVTAQAVVTGGPCTYRKSTRKLEDANTDFIAEEVWPGDLVMARAVLAPADRIYGRVIAVGQHYILIDLQFTIPPAGYGSGYYSQYGYGESDDLIPVSDFTVWVRDTERMDTWRHMDEARYEDIPYLTNRLHDLLSPFVFLAEIRWAAVTSEQSLKDLVWFLDRAKPHDADYLAYTRVEEGTLSEELSGTPGDDDPVVTEFPNFVFVTDEDVILSIIGIDGQIAPNVGSFIGV